jgi:hypothetical protein
MQISVAILVGVNRIKSYIERIIKAFKTRVLSYSNSIFEAELCLVATLRSLNAIGLLDNASLVITPNAYTEGILYDVVPNTTLGDMTVVRATTATRVNSAGLIEVVPRNLLQRSEEFENAVWLAGGSGAFVVTTNSTTAPNGTLTADKLIAPLTNQTIRQNLATINTSFTLSVYLKTNSGTKQMRLFINDTQIESTVNVTSDWQRFTLSGTTGGTLFGSGRVGIANVDILNESSFVYIWGAQLEANTTATEYFPTTTRLNIPRIDYTNGSCPSLLVEPQRTNLVTSSDPTAYTSLGGSGIVFSTFNWGIGLISNSLYYPNNSLDRYYYIPCVNSTTYAISFFAKKDDLTIPKVGNTIVDLTLDLIMDNVDSFTDIQYKLISNNVYRVSGKILSGANFNVVGIRKRLTNSNNGIRISGLQLELGSYPTSYIPTVASTVTRNADVISNTNIVLKNSWTFFLNSRFDSAEPDFSAIYIQDLASSNIVGFYNDFRNVISYSGFAGNFGNALPLYQYNKCCYKYDGTNLKLFKNGILVFNEIRPNIEFKKIYIQGSNPKASVTKTKELVLFNTALTDTECITLTTL